MRSSYTFKRFITDVILKVIFIYTNKPDKLFSFNYYECCNPMLILNVVKLTVVLTN